jgi:hypothetical protein
MVNFEDGPREKAVRATLASRPAGVINDPSVHLKVRQCFTGMFAGCSRTGTLHGDSLKIGKSECEWDWRETWGALKALGLIDWREETRTAPSGARITDVHLTITEKGHQVRMDDQKWFEELMEARLQDEAAA